MSLVRRAKYLLNASLLNLGFRIYRTSDYADLRSFFNSVRPVATNHELIRIGGEADGGYLVPDDLDRIDACFSPGVSKIADFELAFANRRIPCFMADFSVNAPPVKHALFRFEKKFLGPVEDSTFMTLENWVGRNAADGRDMILQMDIEGSEYGVIVDTSHEILRKFRIIVVEFHDLDKLIDRRGLELLSLAFGKLLTDFEVVHIHPNNICTAIAYGEFAIPTLMEFTFLRKDRIARKQPATVFPHPLDRKNVLNREDLPLPRCWYS